MMTIKLIFFLKEEKPNIVHVNDSKMAVTWSIACKLTSIPLIIHQRTVYKKSRLLTFSLKIAAKIISISQFVYDSLPSEFSSKNYVVINPFNKPKRIEKKKAKNIISKKFKIRKSDFIILVLGAIKAKKTNICIKILKKFIF